jgi:hypothetical protein
MGMGDLNIGCVLKREIVMFAMKDFARKAGFAGAVAAGSLGLILGVGTGTASAAPPSPAGIGMDFAQDRGWQDDHGWRGDDRWRDDGRRPGFHVNLPCVTGPLGVVTWCP